MEALGVHPESFRANLPGTPLGDSHSTCGSGACMLFCTFFCAELYC